jgi:hypothetical protein
MNRNQRASLQNNISQLIDSIETRRQDWKSCKIIRADECGDDDVVSTLGSKLWCLLSHKTSERIRKQIIMPKGTMWEEILHKSFEIRSSWWLHTARGSMAATPFHNKRENLRSTLPKATNNEWWPLVITNYFIIIITTIPEGLQPLEQEDQEPNNLDCNICSYWSSIFIISELDLHLYSSRARKILSAIPVELSVTTITLQSARLTSSHESCR